MDFIQLLLQLIRNGMNPQQLVAQILQQNNNPILQNANVLAQNGDMKALEQLARNLSQQRGVDFDKEFNNFRSYFN